MSNNYPQRPYWRTRRISGFTLVELLVVIGIIALLIAIAVPVYSKIRKQAQAAGVQNQIQTLGAQIQAYQQTFGAYPGPLSDDQIYCDPGNYPAVSGRDVQPTSLGVKTASTDFVNIGFNNKYISGSENLVLGLLGGLRLDGANSPYTIVYDPALVGNGPMNLNPNNVKKFNAFGDSKNLSWRIESGKRTGEYKDGGGDAKDTLIPEFVDQFTNPMPILYLRARKDSYGVIRPYPAPANVGPQQYDLKDIIGYTGPPGTTNFIGEGKSFTASQAKPALTSSIIPHGLRTVQGPYNGSGAGTISSLDKSQNGSPSGRTYFYPFDAYAYFEDPSNQYVRSPLKDAQPRAKDSYILISAGPDRVYGTVDDICSFGAVVP